VVNHSPRDVEVDGENVEDRSWGRRRMAAKQDA